MPDSDSENSFDNLPLSVTSPLRTQTVNAPIVLYEGEAIITETSGPKNRTVAVIHEWTPRPAIVCRYSTPGESVFTGDAGTLHEPMSLEIPSLGVKTQATYYDGFSNGHENQHGLLIRSNLEVNENANMTRVVFHVVNGRDFSEEFIRYPSGSMGCGRIVLETTEWRIFVDRTEKSHDLTQVLSRSGGRAITHRV